MGQSRWASATSASVCASAAVACWVWWACARTNIAMSVATWSLRERAVWSLPPTGPASSVTRRSIAMWMSSSPSANGNVPSPSSRSTAPSAACRASRSDAEMIALGGEHRGVRAGLLDVIGPEPPVEADRVVEAPEDGVLWLCEA